MNCKRTRLNKVSEFMEERGVHAAPVLMFREFRKFFSRCKWRSGLKKLWEEPGSNPRARATTHVAQIFNLLYRQVSNLPGAEKPRSFSRWHGLPVANRRYSRLQTCATSAFRV